MANPNPTPMLGQAECHGLATRLRARADSLFFRDMPEMQSDLRAAADLITLLTHYRTQLLWLVENVADEQTAAHLNLLLSGGA
jgi:hypothetical protein